MMRHLPMLLTAIVFALPATATAEPIDYTFHRVAGTEELYTFIEAPVISNDGTVFFVGGRPGVGLAIFSWNGGAVTPVLTTAGPIGNVRQLAVSNNGILTFTASYNVGGGQGVFTYDGATLTTIADTRTSPIFGIGDPHVNNNGTVVFRAGLNPFGTQLALYTGNGGPLTLIADTATLPGSAFLYPAINNKDVVAFTADLGGGGRAIFTSDGGSLTRLYDTTQFPFISSSSGLSDDGRVIFLARFGPEHNGVAIGDGGPIVIVGERTDGLTDFIAAPVINNNGEVVYAAGPGIYTGLDRELDRILRIGDTLFGEEVIGFGLGQGEGLNDDGQVTFRVRLRNPLSGATREIIVRADPVSVIPEPTSLLLLGLGAAGLTVAGWRRHRDCIRTYVDSFHEPLTGEMNERNRVT